MEIKSFASHELVTREENLENILRPLREKNTQAYFHSKQVAGYSVMLAEAAGLDIEEQEQIHICASLHDLGKGHEQYVSVLEDQPLSGEGRREVYRKHPEYGYEMLKSADVSFLGDELAQMYMFVARYHHTGDVQNGVSPIAHIQKRTKDQRLRDEFPAVKDWDKMYKILMIIKIADAFDSICNTYPRNIAKTKADQSRSVLSALQRLDSQFEHNAVSECEKKFDKRFYDAFNIFASQMTQFAELLPVG